MICASCKKDNPASRWDKFKDWLVWRLFPEEMISERSANSTQAFAQGYSYGKQEDKATNELIIQSFKDEIARLKVFKPIDIERVAVRPEEVMKVEKGVCYLGYNPITTQEADVIKNEAQLFKKTLLYRVLQETLKQKAIEKGMILSQNFEETLAAKMMLHNLGIERSLIDICASLTIPKLSTMDGVSQ